MVCQAAVGSFVAGWGVLRIMACRAVMWWWGGARQLGPTRFALVAFALVVGPRNGLGAQGGGGEHGAFESLVAAVGDVLAVDR